MTEALTGLRTGVRSLRVPRGILIHDPLRWRLFQVRADLPAPKLQAFLARHGLDEAAPPPRAAPRIRQIFWVAVDQLPSTDFIVQPEARFACVACGTSCRTLNLGPLMPADVDRLLALDWTGTGRDPGGFFVDVDGQPIPAHGDEPRERFLRREKGGCQFLRADNLCDVHARFGAQAKPVMCRLFPYIYRATPQGIAVAMRLAECSSAPQAVLGTPVIEQRADLAHMLAETDGVGFVPPSIWLDEERLAPYEEYARLESDLLSRPTPDGLAFAAGVWRAFEPRPREPAPPEAMRELEKRTGSASLLPVVASAPRALDAEGRRLEDQFSRLTLFNKELFQHQDLAQAAALLVLKVHLGRRDAAEGTARALNQAWKNAADRQLRELCQGLDIAGLAARAVASWA